MCMLCLRNDFVRDLSTNETRSLKEQAQAIKQDIKFAEAEVESAKAKGGYPCPWVVARLTALKSKQYELAQRI